MKKYAILLKDVKLVSRALSAGTIVEIIGSSQRGYDIKKDDVVINEVSSEKLRFFDEREIIPAEYAKGLSNANQSTYVRGLVDKLTTAITRKMVEAIEKGDTKLKMKYVIDTTDRSYISRVLSAIEQKLVEKGYRVFTTYVADEDKNETGLLVRINW